ncbi:hypothetical protein [Herbiconiux solani]|uniref:hypothetical protein n=1 Tax=Herbiconiux solani TaxID=661329 RepID=UPI000826C11B|nr:hypothetical protein [Herbiconiux solani]
MKNQRRLVALAAGAAIIATALSGCSPAVFFPSHGSAPKPHHSSGPSPSHPTPPAFVEQTIDESCDILSPAMTAFATDLTSFMSDLENDPVAAAASFELVADKLNDAVLLVTNSDVHPPALALGQAADAVNGDLFVAAVYKEQLDQNAFLRDVAAFQTAAMALATVCSPGGLVQT